MSKAPDFRLKADDGREYSLGDCGAWGVKKRYGKTNEGVIRSTFLISPEGELIKAWRNVRAKGHAAKVLPGGTQGYCKITG